MGNEKGKGVKTWAGANAGDDDQRTQTQAATLLPGMNDGTVRVPFKVVSHDAYKTAIKGKGVAKLISAAPKEVVPIARLHGIQRTVNSERLGQYVRGEVQATGNESGAGFPKDLPVVVKTGGNLYLHDGHHRATAAHLRGASEIRARFVDLDALQKEQGGTDGEGQDGSGGDSR